MVNVNLKLEDGSTREMSAMPKEFSTGKTGYFGQGKIVTANGDRYQTQIQMVKIEKKS